MKRRLRTRRGARQRLLARGEKRGGDCAHWARSEAATACAGWGLATERAGEERSDDCTRGADIEAATAREDAIPCSARGVGYCFRSSFS